MHFAFDRMEPVPQVVEKANANRNGSSLAKEKPNVSTANEPMLRSSREYLWSLSSSTP